MLNASDPSRPFNVNVPAPPVLPKALTVINGPLSTTTVAATAPVPSKSKALLPVVPLTVNVSLPIPPPPLIAMASMPV